MRILTVIISLLSCATLLIDVVHSASKSRDIQATTDIRFNLQTEAGLAAHTTLTSTISLDYARQLFSIVEDENNDYIHGEYLLEGRNQTVKLAVGQAGWIVAYHPPDYAVEDLIDCTYSFDVNQIANRPERAVLEVAEALGVTNPAVGFYDFRHPEANGITLHWLYVARNGSIESTLTLPLSNLYLERGFAFCTALSNSEFLLNSVRIAWKGSVSSIYTQWGPLGSDLLRAGQTNTLEASALSFFGTGLLAGVGTEYIGTTEITAAGGYTRNLSLTFPTALGNPLAISRCYLPLINK